MFPLTFTLSIVTLWVKLIPSTTQTNKKGEVDEFSKTDQEQIALTKHAIREFVNNLSQHLKHLQEYLQSVIKEKPLQQQFQLIMEKDEFKRFKEVFFSKKGVGLTQLKTEEFVL